jgi:hypothetical protein
MFVRGLFATNQLPYVQVNNLELCGGHQVNADGLAAIWSWKSSFTGLSCSGPESVGFNFFNNDFEATLQNDSVRTSGNTFPLGFNFGMAFNEAPLISNLTVDGAEVGYNNSGQAGGIMTQQGESITDRGGLLYGWINQGSTDLIQGSFFDMEAANTVMKCAYYFKNQYAPSKILGGQSNSRNGAPFVCIDGGVGVNIDSHIFGTFGLTTPPAQVINIINPPTSQIQLINSSYQGTGVPVSNLPQYVSSPGCGGPVTLAAGAGTVTQNCITPACHPRATDMTTFSNSVNFTAPANGSIGLTGTGTDLISVTCE